MTRREKSSVWKTGKGQRRRRNIHRSAGKGTSSVEAETPEGTEETDDAGGQ